MNPAFQAAALLLICVDETDRWQDSTAPLYEAIVEKLFHLGIRGATVHTGIMGFGANRQVHRKGLFGVTDDRPVTIFVVDEEARLRAALPQIRPMVVQGLVFLVPGELIP